MLAWPTYDGDSLLEWTLELGLSAIWNVDTNPPVISPDTVSVLVANPGGTRFYRLRKL